MSDTKPSVAARILQSTDNFIRGVANGLTFGLADKFAGAMNTAISGGTLRENIASEDRNTEQASQDPAYLIGDR